MSDNWIPILTGVLFLMIGVPCLVLPQKIQEFALKWSSKGLGKYARKAWITA